MDLILSFFIFFLAIGAHEMAHFYYALKTTGKNPKVLFHWSGIEVESDNKKTYIYQKIINHWLGVMAGGIVLWLFNADIVLTLIYVGVSSLDILIAISLENISKSYKLDKFTTLVSDIPCDRCYGKRVVKI